jgi:osmotically-inducible protein OsmY
MKKRHGEILAVCWLCLSPLGAAGAAEATRPSDDTITYWVRTALRDDPRVAAADVRVSTTDGIVTLSGTVGNLAEERYARRESEKIYGVRGVIDRLDVEPKSRHDADIEEDVWIRLVTSPWVKFRSLAVGVAHGAVTLTGAVDSAAARKEAELLATEIVGVRAVHNQLSVTFPEVRPDADIQRDILGSMQRDVYLTGLPISVSVRNGAVTLTGDVGNGYERLRAEDRAWVVPGVRSLDNEIHVHWWQERGVRPEMPFPRAGDLQQAAWDELALDTRLAISGIRVEAGPGLITLRGSVPSLLQKRVAEEDAHNVVGVQSVTNLLEVKPEPRDDEAILRDVQMALDSDYLLSGLAIEAHVRQGVVTLTGTVDNPFEKYHAERVALEIRGLHSLVDTILVNLNPPLTDTALCQRIQDRLAANWETRDLAAGIEVSVVDGKATLAGEVNTLAQRLEAERVARLTDGVLSVTDNLKVIGIGRAVSQGR